MRPAPYPVQATKLETQFDSDPECTHHVKFVSDSALNQRRIRKDEKWRREKELGRGSYGIVWLEKCIQGDDRGILRAVKRVQKPESGEYYRELEAVALFSHAKYEHCFVKSLGWYDDESSIYITMEYLPDGDLQRYLRSPLSEKEARHIILQVLEGLQFMHDNGFTHRDLKPANILVKCKGPDWWVKIADFGISKHVIEEETALRTSVGTPSFAAPEVLGFFRPGDRPKDSYTNAVDLWSLGVIAFFILCAETPFKDPRRLNQYVMGNIQFPSNVLRFNKVSAQGCEFVNNLMAPNSEDRPKVMDCLQHSWFGESAETQGEFNVSNVSSSQDYFEPEFSANWSTQGQNATHEPNKFLEAPPRKKSPLPSGTVTSSNPMSSGTLTPSKAPEFIDTESYFDQSTQDHNSTHEPGWLGMSNENKRPPPRDTSTSLIATNNKAFTPSTTIPYRKIRLPTSTPREEEEKGLPIPSYEPSAIVEWRWIRTFKAHRHSVLSVAFSPDGKLIATGADTGSIALWDSATGNQRKELKGHINTVWAVRFSSDGTILASASHDTRVNLWDLATMTIRHTLRGHTDRLSAVAFSPDGTLLASASWDRTAKLWDLATMKIRHALRGHSAGLTTVAFSPDGKLLASGSTDKTTKLWNLSTGMILHTFEDHAVSVLNMEFSPDGTMLAYASIDKTVKLRDMATMTIRQTLRGHKDGFSTMAFSPDGTLSLTSGLSDHSVTIWDPITGSILESLNVPRNSIRGSSIREVTFSPDGNMIAAAVSGYVIMWALSSAATEEMDLEKGQRRKKITLSNVFKKLLS